jgi:predicted amidophosphoribosyltransferase
MATLCSYIAFVPITGVGANVRDDCASSCKVEAPETCDDWQKFYDANVNCCPDCADQFQSVVDCSQCSAGDEGGTNTTATSSAPLLKTKSYVAALLGVAALV